MSEVSEKKAPAVPQLATAMIDVFNKYAKKDGDADSLSKGELSDLLKTELGDFTSLRLLYEGAPMAFIIEQAGGIATTGTQRILDILPKHIHEKSAVAMGSPEDVKEYLSFVNRK